MSHASSDRKVPTRRMSFEESFRAVPRHFAGDGDLIGSHLTAVLSALFPDGEEFFVRSVRHYRDQITDPELKRQVGGFIGQESIHGREHRAFNDRLAELGYPTKRVERATKWVLETRERLLSPMANLAATAALEHFTATLAELVLSNAQTRDELGHPAVRDLFLWHALEESEHKAVAFDVYKAVGGSERVRVLTMNFFRYSFLTWAGLHITLSLLADRDTYKPGRLRRSLKVMRNSPLADKAIWRTLRDYNRHDFHPDDSDTTALVEQWRNDLFGAQGTMNDKLATSVA